MRLDPLIVGVIDVVEARRHELAGEIADRIRAELPPYACVPREDLVVVLAANVSVASETLRAGGTPSPGLLTAFASLERARAIEGIDAATFIRGIRIAARASTDFAQAVAAEMELDRETAFTLTTTMWDWAEAIADQLAPVDPLVEAQAARTAAAGRLVALCADSGASPDEVEAAAGACGLDPAAAHYVLRARGHGEARQVALDRLRPGDPAQGVAAVIGDEVVAVRRELPVGRSGIAIAAGSKLALSAAHRSYVLAGRVLHAATELGRTGIIRLQDVGLRVLVVEDVDLGQLLQARYLDPLTPLGPFGEEPVASVRSYFEAELNVEEAANTLHIHPNTLRHRLARFEGATGANLHRPEHLAEIWWMLNGVDGAPAPSSPPPTGAVPS